MDRIHLPFPLVFRSLPGFKKGLFNTYKIGKRDMFIYSARMKIGKRDMFIYVARM